jgi:hypothetical protein
MASKQLDQFNELKAKLDKEYEQRLKALREFCGVDESEIAQHTPTWIPASATTLKRLTNSSTDSEKIIPGEYGALNLAVKKSLLQFNGKFTATELWGKVKEIYPSALRPSVSTVLSKLVDDPQSKIVIIDPGVGNKPTIYRREG